MNPEDYESSHRAHIMSAILQTNFFNYFLNIRDSGQEVVAEWEALGLPLMRKIAFIKAGVPARLVEQYNDIATDEIVVLQKHIFVIETLRYLNDSTIEELASLFIQNNVTVKDMSWVKETSSIPLEWLQSLLPKKI